jgi:5'-nucleotidase
MPKPIQILITNDDGVHAPGIQALSEKLREIGEVTVVAPSREMSAISHALTINAPLRYDRLSDRVFAVDGTPADCVNLAVGNLLAQPADILVSGINRGANLGDDVTYSGTVAGAMEGAMLGIPSFAVSLATKGDAEFGEAASFAAYLAPVLVSQGLPRRTFLNVNVPSGPVKGVSITSQGHRDYRAKVEERIDPRARVYFWIKEGISRWEKNGISDITAIRRGMISVTPLQIDLTDYKALDRVLAWKLAWNGEGPPDDPA